MYILRQICVYLEADLCIFSGRFVYILIFWRYNIRDIFHELGWRPQVEFNP